MKAPPPLKRAKGPPPLKPRLPPPPPPPPLRGGGSYFELDQRWIEELRALAVELERDPRFRVAVAEVGAGLLRVKLTGAQLAYALRKQVDLAAQHPMIGNVGKTVIEGLRMAAERLRQR